MFDGFKYKKFTEEELERREDFGLISECEYPDRKYFCSLCGKTEYETKVFYYLDWNKNDEIMVCESCYPRKRI